MQTTPRNLSEAIRQTLDALQSEHPEAGLILIGLTDRPDATEITMAHNVEDAALGSIMTEIVDSRDVSIFPVPSAKALH